METPPPGAIAAILSESTIVLRRLDIYEEDGVTPFFLDAPTVDGTVNVDASRDERRTLDLTLDNTDGDFDNYPGGFWYDKVIKPYRGVQWAELSPSWLKVSGAGWAQTPDSPNHNITSNVLRVIVEVDPASFPPVAQGTLACKWGASGQQSWRFRMNNDFTLNIQYSTTGSNTVTLTSAVIPTETRFFRVDLTINNGASGKTADFYTSDDGISWTTAGSASSTTGGTTPLFDSNHPIMVGASISGTVSFFVGNIYGVQIFDSNRLVTFANFTDQANGDKGIFDAFTGTAYTFGGDAVIDGGVMTTYQWETQLGEFIIDRITTQNFPHTTKVTGRDYTKKLLEDKLPYATTFVAGTPVEDVVRALALNGGITKLLLSPTGSTLGRDHSFEAQTPRWAAMKEIAASFSYGLYFNAQGYLVMEEYKDPVQSPAIFTFETGKYGNLASYAKSASDSRMYNQVVVRSESSDSIPFTAVATNTEPSSPTSVDNLNRTKTYNYTSPFIYSQAQADAIALSRLKVVSLEAFELSLESIVIPWLEADDIVEFVDPDPNPGDPTRFLLVNFGIPLALGTMSASANRVTVVS